MIIPIKKIILEDFDLNQPYISPILSNTENYINTLKSFDKTNEVYNDLLDRGISSNEKKELLRGLSNLYNIEIPSNYSIRDDSLINKYRNDQIANLFTNEAEKNFNNGNSFRERESNLRGDLINKNSEINHLNNKLNSAERYTDHVRSIGDTKAKLYGAGGLIGGGVIGGVLGGVHMANKLKNDENRNKI